MNSWLIPLFGISLAAWAFLREGLRTSEEKVTNGNVDNREICNSKECLQVANDFLNSMNESVDPCVDFYKFACDNFETHNTFQEYGYFPDSMERFSHLSRARLRDELEREISTKDIVLVQKMKKFYKSCMEMTPSNVTASVNAVLRGANGWPMIMSSGMWNKSSTTWQEIDRYYEELSGTNAFFDLKIPDVLSEHAELQIGFFEDPTEFSRFGRERVEEFAQLLIGQNERNVSNETFKKDTRDVNKFIKRLQQISKNSTGEVSFTSIDSFMQWWEESIPSTDPRGKIDWRMVLQRLFNIANHQQADDTTFRLMNVSYFRQLPEILQSTDERTIVNFIHWNFVFQMMTPYGKTQQVIIIDPLLQYQPRWLDCLRQKEPAMVYPYLRKYYGDDRKAAATELIVNMQKSFEFQMTNSNWLSAEAKEAAKEKLRRMKHMLGHEDWYINETALNDYYKGLIISDDHLRNILSLEKNKRKALIKLWGKPMIYKQWIWSVLEANGEYDRQWNFYNTPAGTFQSPLFDHSMPDYVGYGTTGYLIGHEIGHGFDSNTIDDGLRPNEPLFTDDMIEIYRERTKCFVDVFEEFSEGSGNRTLAENIADWSGLQAALHAYKEVKARKHPYGELKLPGFLEFTDLQMFFLSFAQSWCTGHYEGADADEHALISRRVNGTLYNTLAFAEAFNCPRNSPMNPEKKCNLWMT